MQLFGSFLLASLRVAGRVVSISSDAGWSWTSFPHQGPVLQALQAQRLHSFDRLLAHLQDRWLCRHQGEWSYPQGYAPQVLSWTHWYCLERHQARRWCGDEQAGKSSSFHHQLIFLGLGLCFVAVPFLLPRFEQGSNATFRVWLGSRRFSYQPHQRELNNLYF